MGPHKRLVLIISVSILCWSLITQKLNQKNACKDFISYTFSSFSQNCYYIPDNGRDSLEIIKSHTGVGESHKITTEDGYILTLFRIPRKNPKGVVFLQHGISHDSRFFLAQYNKSVAFFFWENGCDVWLGNSRGTTYSNKHISLNTEEEKYWNFSFHEMGYYDLHSSIEYIKDVTEVSKINFVGLSMGSTSALVYASLRSETASNSLNAVINLAPYCFATSEKTFIKEIILGLPNIAIKYRLNNFLEWHSFLDHNSWYLRTLRSVNKNLPIKYLILNVGLLVLGGRAEEVDPNVFNLIIDQFGSASSLKAFAHLYQLESSRGQFQMFDYGHSTNIKVYGTPTPPAYPLENIKVPQFTLYGGADKLSLPQDVEVFYSTFFNNSKLHKTLKIEDYTHHDFLFGVHRNERVYDKIFKFLDVVNK